MMSQKILLSHLQTVESDFLSVLVLQVAQDIETLRLTPLTNPSRLEPQESQAHLATALMTDFDLNISEAVEFAVTHPPFIQRNRDRLFFRPEYC